MEKQVGALRAKSWNPYAVGALLGILSWLTFASANKLLGITTAFENTAAMIGENALPQGTPAAYRANPDKNPKIDWEWMLVLGVFIGAYLSSRLSKDRAGRGQVVPELWKARFGPSAPKRLAGAFIGGATMMFGARMAQGCTSGHGISGLLQLAVSSQVFMATFFVAGVATAFALFGKEAPRQVYGPTISERKELRHG